ncbi:MAG: heterodisulfide reductase-related iron-sulfur binding cluster [Acidobacteriaceae bacterium]
MTGSKALVSQALAMLQENIERTGDPLGFRHAYWTEWASGLELPRGGPQVLLTARMYQMLPYLTQTTAMVEKFKPLVASRSMRKLVSFGSRLAGETIVRRRAEANASELKIRCTHILRGIVAALAAAGIHPGYLYEDDPYSGALLYDLGLEGMAAHAQKTYRALKDRGVREVITVDPHTTYILRTIYPQYIEPFELQVTHYLELLATHGVAARQTGMEKLPTSFVVHDSCVMARHLKISKPLRTVVNSLNLSSSEPENTGNSTACCGGPIEYAFGELSEQISEIRVKELAAVEKNILVTCPICLINLGKHQVESGSNVYDIGESLYSAYVREGA